MEVVSNVILNLQTPAYSTVYAPQGDTLTRKIRAQLMDGSTPWTVPSGATMVIRYRKPDGTVGYYDTDELGNAAYTVSGEYVTFTLAAQTMTVAGAVYMQLDFYAANDQHLSTFTLTLDVSAAVVADGEIASEDYINALTRTAAQLARDMHIYYGAPRAAATSAAMTDHDLVYVFTGSTSGGFTNGHWYYWNGSAWTDGGVYNSVALTTDTTLTVAGAAADAKATGDEIKAFTGLAEIPVVGVGQYIDLSGTTADISSPGSSENFYYRLAQCTPGDTFTINAHGGSNARAFAFVAQNGTILTVASSSYTAVNHLTTAPDNAYYIIVNDRISEKNISYAGLSLDIVDSINDKTGGWNTGKRTIVSSWGPGTLDSSTGAETTSSHFIRSGHISYNPDDVIVPCAVDEITGAIGTRVYYYDGEGAYLGYNAGTMGIQYTPYRVGDFAPSAAPSTYRIACYFTTPTFTNAPTKAMAYSNFVAVFDSANSVAAQKTTSLASTLTGKEAVRLNWTSGTYSATTGAETSATTWRRSNKILYDPAYGIINTHIPTYVRWRAYFWDAEDNYLDCTDFIFGNKALFEVAIPGAAKFALAMVGVRDNSINALSNDYLIANLLMVVDAYGTPLSDYKDPKTLYDNLRVMASSEADRNLVFSSGEYSFTIKSPFDSAFSLWLDYEATGNNAPFMSFKLRDNHANDLWSSTVCGLPITSGVTRKEYRFPAAYQFYNHFYMKITVPDGTVLKIANAAFNADAKSNRESSAMMFNSLHGEPICNSDTLPRFECAVSLGYKRLIATPKRSSDGVWFLYHDDSLNVNTTFIRDDNGDNLDVYDGQSFDTIPYTAIRTWDFGVSKSEIWKGIRALTLEEYFSFCAKNGVFPSLSMHPSSTYSTANLAEVKTLAEKYGCISTLELKYPTTTGITNAVAVFGNSICKYVLNIPYNKTDEERAAYITAAVNALTGANIPLSKLAIEIFASEATQSIATEILSYGCIASIAQGNHTHADGTSSTLLYTSEIDAWRAMGYTEFTLTQVPYYGLNY